ncbi:MAG: hypothetical protein ACWA6U_09710 [Breznakibacter sp.]
MIPENDATGNRLPESETHKKVRKIYEAHPDDAFVQALMDSTPPTYVYNQDKSDDDLLYDTLKEKYDL